jgi:hypothetical protein
MFKIQKYVMFIFMQLQYLSPHEPMVGWLKICHMVVEVKSCSKKLNKIQLHLN